MHDELLSYLHKEGATKLLMERGKTLGTPHLANRFRAPRVFSNAECSG